MVFSHTRLIKLYSALGYSDPEGLCFGFSIRYIEAILSGQKKQFEDRLRFINHFNSDDELFAQMVEDVKSKKGENLTFVDKLILDIMAFFESIHLYQNAESIDPIIFNTAGNLNQFDTELISPVASSDEILSQGGLKKCNSTLLAMNKDDLKKYLKKIHAALYASSTNSAGFLLSSIDHAVVLIYDQNKKWIFLDINSTVEKQCEFVSDQIETETTINLFTNHHISFSQLVKAIIKGLTPSTQRSDGGYFHLQPFVLRTNYDAYPHAKLHSYNKENFNKLCTSGNLNDSRGYNTNLTCLATEYGYAEAFAALATHGADFNKADNQGMTPAQIAAYHGHVKVITELAKHGADFNKANNQGGTPAWIAAQNGHANVIAKLAMHGATLDKADNRGITPARITAEYGHVNVIKVLAKHGVNLCQTNRYGETLDMTAARHGHLNVIKALVKIGVKFNRANKDGKKAIDIAKSNGHIDIVKFILKQKVIQSELSVFNQLKSDTRSSDFSTVTTKSRRCSIL